jgi:hypothetical protein
MSIGVRVIINTKDDNNNPVTEYGYIVRRLNAHLYEIWGESSQIIFFLSPEEFTEINV